MAWEGAGVERGNWRFGGRGMVTHEYGGKEEAGLPGVESVKE